MTGPGPFCGRQAPRLSSCGEVRSGEPRLHGVALALVVVLLATAAAAQTTVYSEHFESYAAGARPAGWVETPVEQLDPSDAALFSVTPDPLELGNAVYGPRPDAMRRRVMRAFDAGSRSGTFSTLTTKQFTSAGGFEFRGRLLRTAATARIGLSFFSAYPAADQYYLVALAKEEAPPNALTMQLTAFPVRDLGTHGLDSAFSPEPGRWYRFAIRVTESEGANTIRARFWPDGGAEPSTWSIDATDRGSRRLTNGHIGVWVSSTGESYVDDLEVRSTAPVTPPPPATPTISFLESGVELDPAVTAIFNRDVKLEVRTSSGLTPVVTLDGNPAERVFQLSAEGTHQVEARLSDGVASTLRFIIDKTPPSASLLVDGQPLTPGAMFNHPVHVTVSASDATATTVDARLDGQSYAAGSEIGSEGQHSLLVTVKDAAGWQTALPAVAFSIDRTPPTIVFDAPAAGQTVGSSKLTASGKADDAVALTLNGAAAALDPATHRFNATVPLVEGENTITASATDAAGNTGTQSLKVVLDSHVPDLTIEQPSPDACLDVSAIDVAGRIGNAEGILIKVRSGGTIQDATVAADGSWRSSIPAGAEGPLTFTVEATDPAGHTASLTRSVTIDRTPPTVAVLESGQPFTASVINRAVAFVIRASDNSPGAVATAILDGVPYTEGTPISDESREHELHLIASDCAGHTSPERVISFRIDTTPPKIGSVYPPAGATVGTMPQVRGTADPDTVSVAIDETGQSATMSPGGSFTFTEVHLAPGANHFTLVATDLAGNRSRTDYALTFDDGTPAVTITVDGVPIADNAVFRGPVTPVIATNDPAAVITATLNGAPYTSGTPITANAQYTLTAAATDHLGRVSAPRTAVFSIHTPATLVKITSPAPKSSIKQSSVDVLGTLSVPDIASVVVNGVFASISTDGKFIAPAVHLEPGPNMIVATATDRAGNSATDSVEVTRDDTAPSIILIAPQDRSLTNRRSVTVEGQTLTQATSVTVNGLPATIEPNGTFRVADLPVAAGDNTITATATTALGTTNTAIVHVTADWTPPLLMVTANGVELTEGSRFTAAPVIAATAADPNGATVGATLDGAPATLPITNISSGGHSILVTAHDAAGNEARVERLFIVGGTLAAAGCTIDAIDPANGSNVYGDEVTISGRANFAGVLVGAQPVPVVDGWFSARLPLVPARNDIRIACADTTGAAVATGAVTLTLYRTPNPSIAITSPETGDELMNAKVTVSGTVGEGVVSGDVNGLPFTPRDGLFTVPNVPLANGPNVIVARARTASGRVAVATARVRYPGAAPLLAITSPLDGTQTGATEIDVTGMYANVDPATLGVQGATITTTGPQSDTTGTFRASMPLTPGGRTTIKVTGQNRVGVEGSATVQVDQLPNAPWIAITSPKDNTIYAAAVAKPDPIIGSISQTPGAKVTVNGLAATAEKGGFTGSVPFAAGNVTQVIARVTAPDGSTASDSVRLLHVAKALAVRDSFPLDGATAVDPAAMVVVAFTNPVDGPTASKSMALHEAGGAVVPGEFWVDRDTVTFSPLRPLTPGARYTMAIAKTLRDVTGGALAEPVNIAFAVASSAPMSPPQLDQKDTSECVPAAVISGHAINAGSTMRIDLDGATSTTQAGPDKAFSFKVGFPSLPGVHVIRVREIGADGSLSPEAAVVYRVNCAGPEVTSASVDREAKKVTIVFSRAMKGQTLMAGPGGTVLVFLEGGAPLPGTVTMDGATATVALSADLGTGAVTLVVKKGVQDTDGRPMAEDYTHTFAVTATPGGGGKGFATGRIIDATTGRPLVGARVTFRGPMIASSGSGTVADEAPSATTDERGRFSRSLDEGVYAIEATADGCTNVWRRVVILPGGGIAPLDARLTRRGASRVSGADLTMADGGDTAVTRRAELTLSAASIASGRTVSLTATGGQALAGLLPLGWSPLASAEIAIDGAVNPLPLTSARLAFALTPDDVAELTAAGQSLSLVSYDADRDEWRTLVAAVAVQGGTAASDIPFSGSYALVYSDRAPPLRRPPPARAGSALAGVEDPCAAAADLCRITSRRFTLDPPTVLPSGRATATLVTDGASTTYPSGTAVQAYVDEQLNLADGRVLAEPPFTTDLVVYRTLSGGEAVARFHLAPGARAASVVLRDGVDHVRVVDYPGRVDRGALIGRGGGRVPGDDITVEIPPGAVGDPVHASVRSLTASEVAELPAVAGFTTAAAFELSLTRTDESKGTPILAEPAVATFRIGAPPAQVIVAEVLPETPYGALVRLAASAISDSGTGSFRTAPRGELPVDGIIRSATYLVLVPEQPIAFAFGKLNYGASTMPASGARQTSGVGAPQGSVLGVRDVARRDGLFVVPVASAPAAPFSIQPRTPALGDGTPFLASRSPAMGEVVDVGTVSISAVRPKLVGMSPHDGEIIDATKPLVVRAEFDIALDPTQSAPVQVTTTDGEALHGTTTVAGAVLSFAAGERLRAGSRYTVTLSPRIRAASGAEFGSTVVAQFTTPAIPPANNAIAADRITITVPNAAGVSTIRGRAGALPAGDTALATRHGRAFIAQFQGTVADDGSFSFTAGGGIDRISIADALELQVVDKASGAVIARIPLSPFVVADGSGFVAPPDRDVSFATATGATVRVPAGAFAEPTAITVSDAVRSDFAAVPSFERELTFGGGIAITFEGTSAKRIEVDIPAVGATDGSISWYFGLFGDSTRGPRLMLVAPARIQGGHLTSAEKEGEVASAGATPAAVPGEPRVSSVLTGTDLRSLLFGVRRGGRYAAVAFNPAVGPVMWAAITGLTGDFDLFWTPFDALFAAHFYLTEARGRIAIPIPASQPFELVGVDATTGLNAFSRIYDPIVAGDPGAIATIPSPSTPTMGPYPIAGSPFRIEQIDVAAENVDITTIPNFVVSADGVSVKVRDAADPLPAGFGTTLLDATRGSISNIRNALSVAGGGGDRVVLFAERGDVDPSASLSLVFSEPVYPGPDLDESSADAFLHQVFELSVSASESLFTPVPGVRYRLDSGGRRLLIDLPSSLVRGARYRLRIRAALAADVPDEAERLRFGQAVVNGTTTPARTADLFFRVRAPAGHQTAFTVPEGSIRDEALNGNVLFLSTTTPGALYAFDVADPASTTASSMLTRHTPPTGDDVWAIASDAHDRIYTTTVGPMFGVLRAYRMQDVLPDASHPAPRSAVLPRASSIVAFSPGVSMQMPLTSATVLSDRPEALPRKLQILVRDRDEVFESAGELRAHYGGRAIDDGEFSIIDSVLIPRSTAYPYLVQRITIENETLDLHWSADAYPDLPARFDGVVARKWDRLRVVWNEATYGVVSLFGYGLGVYDLNAIESNDDPAYAAQSAYRAAREVVRLTKGEWSAACHGMMPASEAAIRDLTFAPEAAIFPAATSGDLRTVGVEAHYGVVDLLVHPPSTAEQAALPPDLTGSAANPLTAYLCDERPTQFGLRFVVPPGAAGVQDFHPRIAALRSRFIALAGRPPLAHFSGIASHHWTIEAQDNRAIGSASGGGAVPGARGSVAGERAERDYVLVPGAELGLLVVEVSGSPSSPLLGNPAQGLLDQHLCDVIWIPRGAYAVRSIPRTKLASVVDGDGRVLLVDLSRLDERWAPGGQPADPEALFATASACLAANGSYGVGTDDPRIIWKSEPRAAAGTLAPVIDSDTGFLYAAQLAKQATDVISAFDPRIVVQAELAQRGGLSEVGGIVPLGVDPPREITDKIAAGDPARIADASLAAFRLEIRLPGSLAETLAAAGGVRMAVESETVATAAAAEMPIGYPRAHLRTTTRSGQPATRPASSFVLRRSVPQSQAVRLRRQRGFNRFVSPWIVAIADPRASIEYPWAANANPAVAGCTSCARPAFLQGRGEAQDVWEIFSAGRVIALRPELAASASGPSNVFNGTPYAWLGARDRLSARIATVPADTLRPVEARALSRHPPRAPGLLQESVLLHSGEAEVSHDDFDFGGRNGWNVALSRRYRSRTLGVTALGQGWDTPLAQRLRVMPDGSVEYRDGSGDVWRFAASGGGYRRPTGLFASLAAVPRGGWRLTDMKGRVTAFDALGRIAYECDEFTPNPDVVDRGNVIRYLYGGDGRLAAIRDPVGRLTHVAWYREGAASEGLLRSLTDWRGRSVEFTYDSLQRLTSVALPAVPNTDGVERPVIRYAYAAGATTDELLEIAPNLLSIADPAAPAPRVTLTYGTGALRDRVTGQQWATGESASFAYSSPTSIDVTDVLQQRRTVSLTSDRQSIASIDEAGVPVSTFAFGALTDLATLTPPRTTATRRRSFAYDAEGELTRTTLEGISETTNNWNALPLGELLRSSTTTAVVPANGAPVTHEVAYQPTSTGAPAFVRSVKANGVEIESPEPGPAGTISATNDGITRTTVLNEAGLPKRITATGGTDPASSSTSTVSLEYNAATAPAHARGLPRATVTGGSGAAIVQELEYPDASTVVEHDGFRGTTTTTKRDTWDRPVEITTTGNGPVLHRRFEYDASGRLRRETREQGTMLVTSETDFDAIGRVVATRTNNIEVGGSLSATSFQSTTTSYDLPARRITAKLPSGATVATQLDGLGRVQSRTTHPGGLPIAEEFVYDAADDQVWSADNFTVMAAAFDVHGNQIASIDADGRRTTTSGFDGWGNPKGSETTAAGQLVARSTIDLTPSGRMKKSSTELAPSQSATTEQRWDEGGRTTSSATGNRAYRAAYDGAGRLASWKAGEGSAEGVTAPFRQWLAKNWQSGGALVSSAASSERNASPIDLGYEYDTGGNRTRDRVGPLEWRNSFDEAGNVVSAAEPNRKATAYSNDAAGKRYAEQRADGSTLRFDHNAAGGESAYHDPEESTVVTDADLLGRPLSKRYPDGTTEKFTYEASRLQSTTDRQGRTLVYAYDERGRLSEIRRAGGEPVERTEYDFAGRVSGVITPDARVEFTDYDLGGRPHTTRQTRYRDGSGFGQHLVLDSFEQKHEWDEHGQRTSFTMPFAGTSAGWTTRVATAYDAEGNPREVRRQLARSASESVMASGDFRAAGRPNGRTVTTECTGVEGCSPATIERRYGYDSATGQLKRLEVRSHGELRAGAEVAHDGLQVRASELLGIAGGRVNAYAYDDRSRLVASSYGRPSDAARSVEALTPADFRTSLTRPPGQPADPPSLAFAQSAGHKIAGVTRGGATRTVEWDGSERRGDGRWSYEFDVRGRLRRMTERPHAPDPLTLRRITYFYAATDRVVGRRAELAHLVTAGATPAESDWKVETRDEILASDALPAETTFLWDAVADRLAAVFRAGPAEQSDPDAGLLRQIVHGANGYDDPLEVTVAAPGGVRRLYPAYDEAAAGSLQAVFDANGDLVARSVPDGAYGEDETTLRGVAVDRIALAVKKDAAGGVSEVSVTMRTTEAIASDSAASGGRIAAVSADGTLVRTSHAAAALVDGNSLRWTFTPAEWGALTDPASVVVDGRSVTPSALSIAATNALRGAAWPAGTPLLPAPRWAREQLPVRASAELPVDYRHGLSALASWIAAAPASKETSSTLYDVPSLRALADVEPPSTAAAPERLLTSATFHALPFADPATGLLYARARWYDPTTGTFVTADRAGYRDSSTLYGFSASDPVNARDPSGLLTVIIHGTGAAGTADFLPGGAFFEHVRATVKDRTVASFQWSGSNTDEARREAAARLMAHIHAYPFAAGEELNIIGHSHGGNVALLAVRRGLLRAVDNLVLLGTPIRARYFIETPSDVTRLVSVYNPYDLVQQKGGGADQMEFEFGGAWQTYPNRINLAWNEDAGYLGSHRILHTARVWDFAMGMLRIRRWAGSSLKTGVVIWH